jgi:uncharacterized repeat protein (TIGR01451 family)
VSITDLLPAGVTYSSDTPSQGAYVSGTGVWTVGTINSGASATLAIQATVDAGTSGSTITNTITVVSLDQIDSNITADDLSEAITVNNATDLSLTMIVDNATPNVGDNVTFTITVNNSGPDNASGVAVTDLIPVGYNYVSDTGGGSYNPGTGLWALGNLLNGVSASLDITCTVNGGGAYNNSAEVTAADQFDPDSTPGNGVSTEDDQDIVIVTVTLAVDPGRSSVTASPSVVTADGVTTSTITITLLDGAGNPVSGKTVTIATDRGGIDVITQPAAPTDANGQTTATVSSTVTGPSTVTATNVTDTIVLTQQPVVFFTQGQVLDLTKTANKEEVVIGDVVTYRVEIRNTTASDVVQVNLVDIIPPHFKYLKDSARLNNSKIPDPGGSRKIVFKLGTVPALVDGNGNGRADPGEQGYMKLNYQLIVGSGAAPGEYKNIAVAKDVCDSCIISNQVEDSVTVTFDPTFDLGTIIGKVFDDKNRDGWQDQGEEGVAGVMVALDDGTYALTDEYGRYHFPAINPGHRMLKINLRSLADGAEATTDETVVVSVTPGLLAKANFGVLYTPDILKTGKPPAPGISMQSDTVPQPIQVTGTADTLTVLINGELAAIPTREIRLQVKSLDEVVEIQGNHLKPVVFKTEGNYSSEAKAWRLNIMDAKGDLVRTISGNGNCPENIRWNGKINGKQTIKGGEIYQYQIEIEYTDGSRATSAQKLFGVNQTSAISINLTGEAFITGSAELSPRAQKILKDTADILRKYPKEKIIIEGHTDSMGSEAYNLDLSKRRAEAALAYLVTLEKLPAERFVVRWYGESRPIASNEVPETRALNRRIEIKGEFNKVERSKLYDQYRTEPSVKINGSPMTLDSNGRFSMDVADETMKAFSIEVVNAQGRSARTTFSIPSIEILKPADQLLLPYGTSGPEYSVGQPGDSEQTNTKVVLVKYELVGRTDPGNAVEIDGKPVRVKSDGTFKTPLLLVRGSNPFGIIVRDPDGATRIVNLMVTVNDRDENGEVILVTEPVPNLTVKLPPKGVPLTNQLLTLSGNTDAGNRVLINTEPVTVEANGHFSSAVTLPMGKSTLQIQAIDSEGRVGTITRDVEVKDTHFFFLAFADGKISKLKLKDSEADDPKDYYTEGRVAFYLKGVVKGKYLVTAALDTGTDEFNKLFKDLDKPTNDRLLTNLDPDKYYPVYGDNSTIVYDTESQSKLYLAIDSDEFHLLLGNYQLNLSDTELATYQRTLFGAKVAYESVSKTQYGQPDTKITVFGAEGYQVPVTDELTATGGSLYYLSHREVIEGSEQVTIVVRDKNTGLILARLPQQRNIDYNIKYEEGRLLFKRPISSRVADDTIIDQDLLAGSQVFIQVNYEAVEDSFEANAVGGRLRQQIGDHVAVGGTYINDELSASEYELQAVDTEVRLGKNTRIIGEYAESTGTDSRVFVSADGGLTFNESAPNGTEEGRAWKIAVEVDVGEWFGTPDRYQIGGYFKQLEEGFISNGNFLEEGTEKSGVNMSLQITDHDKFKARFDQVKTEGVGSKDETETDIAILQWNHDRGWWSLTGEYQANRSRNFTTDSDDYTNFIAARLRVNPIEDLTVNLEHQETLSGDKNDQFTAGLQYQLFEQLALDASGTTGTKGQSMQGGVTLSLDEGQRVYLNQRLTDESSGRTSSTVVGAEAPVGDTAKIYSEYQWEHTQTDDRNVSLMGARRQWEAVKGLDILLSGELSNIEADAEDTTRYTLAGGVSYASGSGFKASTRQEIRRETGDEDRFQYLTTNNVEVKLNPDFTALGKLRYSQTDDLDLDETEAFFREYSVGLAYRPVKHDRFNALAKYTRLAEQGPEDQVDGEPFVSDTDVASIEWSFDINRWLEWVEKAAYKTKTEEVGAMPENTTHTFLSINRLNINIWKKFDLGLEYRLLHQEEAEDMRKGWLTELMWKPVKHFRIGVGWNFTDFSDNEFSDNDYSQEGWFLRFQGTF